MTGLDPNRLVRSVRRDGDVLHLELAGEWDLYTQPEFDQAVHEVLRAPPRLVVVDLRAVEFISSVGLHACAGLGAAGRYAGWRVALVEGSETVQRAFRVVGLMDQFEWVERPEDLPELG